MAGFEILITAKNAAKAAFANLQKDLKGVAKDIKNLDEQYEAATKSAREMISSGVKLAALGAGAFAGFAFPVKKAAEFERAMSKVQAITGATGKPLEELSNIAKEMGKTTEYTAREAAEGLTFLGMAGLSAAESVEALPGALELATVGGISLAQAADYATNVLSGMGSKISDLGRVNDNMAYTASNANTSVTELADAMVTAGPAAQGAGIQLEEVVSVLGGMAGGGIKASRAGFAVKRMLSLLQDPTGKAASHLKKMGIATHDIDGQFRGLLPIISEMGEKQISLNDANEAFGLITGVSAIAAANNSKKMNDLRKGLDGAEGSAKKMAEIMRDNVVGAFKELRSAVEALLMAFGEPMLDIIKSIIKSFANLIRTIADIVGYYKTFSKVIMVTVAVIGSLLIALGSVGIALGGVIFAFTSLHKTIVIFQSLVLWTRIQLWVMALKDFIIAINLTTVALGAGLILAIGHLIYQLNRAYKAYKQMKQAHDELANSTDMLAEMEHKGALRAQKAAKDTGLKIKNFKQLINLQKQGLIFYIKEIDTYYKSEEAYNKARQALEKYNTEKSKTSGLEKQIGDLKEFQKAAEDSYTYAMDLVKQYANKIVEFNEKIKYHRLSTEDKIRQINRKSFTEEQVWNDKKLQAEEKVAKAREALRKGDYKLSEKLTKDAESLYADLAVEISKIDEKGSKVIVKSLNDSSKVAKDGLKTTETLFINIINKQKQLAEESAKSLMTYADKIKKAYDEIKKYMSDGIPLTFDAKQLSEIQEKINNLKSMSESKFDINVDMNFTKVMEDLKVKVTPEIRLEQGTFTNLQEDMKNAFKIEDGVITNVKEQQRRMYYIDDGVITNVQKQGAKALTIEEALVALNKERKKEAHEINSELASKNQKLIEVMFKIKESLMEKANKLINSVFDINTKKVDNVTFHINRMVNAFTKLMKTPIPSAPPPGYATGGRLPGFGGGDKLTIRAEPGEYVINKFTVKALGTRFFDFINSIKSSGFSNDLFSRLSVSIPKFDIPKLAFQSGGVVPNLQTKELGTLDLNFNGTLYPVMGEVDVLEQLKTNLEHEKLTRSM